ncbi:Retrovirus-related Pol polyprotein from transposon 17.6 [Ixodes scapularis]
MGNMTELLFDVAKANFISVLDMTRGYWQIALDDDSQKLCAFATPRALYAWKVMPYGLRNSAATFQRVMNEVLREHRGYACAYIDHVAVYLESWEDHVNHLRAVLQTLKNVGLTVNPTKCKFAQSRVKYLGHVVGSGTHSPDPERVQAIAELKPPRTKRDVRSAQGLLNYYRDYIPRYSEIVLSLTELTHRRVPNVVPWNKAADDAFRVVKAELVALPALTARDPDREYVVTTDASEFAVGACLSQEVGGTQRPIAFLSKKLSDSQAKWSATEREAYALVWALGKLDTWLFGAKIKVATDHNPLTYLTRSASSSARLTRWSLALQRYDIEIIHIRGSLNKCADALSRLDRHN